VNELNVLYIDGTLQCQAGQVFGEKSVDQVTLDRVFQVLTIDNGVQPKVMVVEVVAVT
jgi:hypothetical protein